MILLPPSTNHLSTGSLISGWSLGLYGLRVWLPRRGHATS
jgi:hypothetical protein